MWQRVTVAPLSVWHEQVSREKAPDKSSHPEHNGGEVSLLLGLDVVITLVH